MLSAVRFVDSLPSAPLSIPGELFFPSFPSEHQQLLKEEEEEDYIDLM